MSDTADLTLDQLLCFAVYSANLAFNRVYRPLLDRLGLTYLQYLVLQVLWRRDDVPVGDLGERLFLTSSTLTPVLKRLESLGLLTRCRDGDDERRVRIRLTAAGSALQGEARDLPRCIAEASGLEGSDMAALVDSLSGLRDRLIAATEVG